jgi:dihydroxy-acid dehydratase
VEEAELARRRAAAENTEPAPALRGYARLYQQEILDADEGCDFAFLRPPS